MTSVNPLKSEAEKCAIDHILEAQKKGEINEDNVLYIVENINVAGTVAAAFRESSSGRHILHSIANLHVGCHKVTELFTTISKTEIDCLCFAAIETTLWSIEWGVAELVNNPEIQTRIRNELDSILGKGNLVSEPDTYNNKLPYLSAFVKEVMRLHMAIPLLVPHMNINHAKLAGYDIPAESKILVNAWWIGNNPKLWEQPEKFMPERFLNGKIEASGNDFRFLPFGAGRRACPGIIIAMPLLSIVLGRLVQSFELFPPAGVKTIDMAETGGQFSLRIATHYNVVVKPIA